MLQHRQIVNIDNPGFSKLLEDQLKAILKDINECAIGLNKKT